MTKPTRRQALALALAVPQPRNTPPGVRALLDSLLARDPASFNTDWFGTMPIAGILQWARLGDSRALPFARRWFEHQLQSGTVSKFSGAKSREIVAGGLRLTTYAGHYGAAVACEELAAQTGDERARRVCVDLGRIILHEASRNRLGLVNHDDFTDFAIPDTCYFVVSALLAAAAFDPARRAALREQALFQLRAYTDAFLVPETGLAKTALFRDGLGKTYWTRASGWLLWAMVAVLRRMPPEAHAAVLPDLLRLAEGMTRVQDSGGGFHVLLDEEQTPLESSGALMFAMGVHEALRRGWLPPRFAQPAGRAWQFVASHIDRTGGLRHCYTGWAIPAERRQLELMRTESDGWAAGFTLSAAAEMLA
jgi:rhamnogalacturonyl hydrolase YesR